MYHIFFIARHTPYKCSTESHTQYCLLPYRPLNDDNILFFSDELCFIFQLRCLWRNICIECTRDTNFVVFASYFHMRAWKICTLVNAFIQIHAYAHMLLSRVVSLILEMTQVFCSAITLLFDGLPYTMLLQWTRCTHS